MKSSRWMLVGLAGCLSVAIGFGTGCATTARPPSIPETERIREGRASLVLLRLQLTWEGKPVRGLKGYGVSPSPRGGGFWVRLADLETSAPPRNVLPVLSPSVSAQKSGWIYLVLPAGSYWFSLVPPGAVSDATPTTAFSTVPPLNGNYGLIHHGEFDPVPAFRLEVRQGEPVLYAGSLYVVTTNLPNERPDGPPFVSARVVDETEAARQLVQTDLAPQGFATLHTRCLEDYDRTFGPAEIHDLAPIGLATLQARHLENPNWVNRSLKLWMTPSGVLLSMASGPGDPRGAAGLVALGIAYAPIGALGGWIHGTVTKEKWESTLEALDRELEEMKPNLNLIAGLKTQFANHLKSVPIDVLPEQIPGTGAPEAPSQVRGMMIATLTRVRLREGGKRGMFAVEVGFRIRLWDTREQRWRYDRAFVYTEFNPEKRIPLDRPYETLLPASSRSGSFKDYRGPEGRAHLREEVQRAIDLVIEELGHDLGLTPFKP